MQSSVSGSGSIAAEKNGKWAVNIQDIMKREKNNMMNQLGNEYVGGAGDDAYLPR